MQGRSFISFPGYAGGNSLGFGKATGRLARPTFTLDATNVSSLTFRPVRQFVAANKQTCTRAGTGSSDPAYFINGSYTQFTLSTWLRPDYDSVTDFHNAGGQGIFGKWSITGNNCSWLLSAGAGNGTTAPLNLLVGTNSADGTRGAFRGSVAWNNAFLSSGGHFYNRCWLHLMMFYDGSQSNDGTKCQLYINGSAATMASPSGTTLAAKVGDPLGTSLAPFGFQSNGGVYGNYSVADTVLCQGVPGSYATAVADVYALGQGVNLSQWPASAPAVTMYYAGNDNWSSNGTAPSGPMADSAGTAGGTLTADTTNFSGSSNPGGQLQVTDLIDTAGGCHLKCGYSPVTGVRKRIYEFEYGATIRGGKPGIMMRGSRAGADVGCCYAYGTGNFTDLFGASGSVFFNGMASAAIANVHNVLSFCDDVTNRGNGTHGIRRAWGVAIFGQNHSLKASTNRVFLSLQINDTVDGSPTAPGLPADFQGFNGNENLGLPFNAKLITACVSGTSSHPKLTVTGHGFTENQWVTVGVESGSGVTGVAGDWQVHVVDANTIELQGTTFGGTFTAGDGSLTSYSWVMDKAMADVMVPGLNTVFSFECYNNGNGTDWPYYAGFNTAGSYPAPSGPLEFYCGNQSTSQFYLDTGQINIAGHAWSNWFNDPTGSLHSPPGPSKLTAVVLNGMSEVDSGSWTISGVNDFVFGAASVTPVLSPTKRLANRTAFANK